MSFSSGTLAGDNFLIVDCNGTAGYQASQDLVIELEFQRGAVSVANFG